jgi:hypothetical protein
VCACRWARVLLLRARITPPRARVRVRVRSAPVSPGLVPASHKARSTPARHGPQLSLQSLARERTHASAPEDVSTRARRYGLGKSGVSLLRVRMRTRTRNGASCTAPYGAMYNYYARARAQVRTQGTRAGARARPARARLANNQLSEAEPSRKSTLRARNAHTHARARPEGVPGRRRRSVPPPRIALKGPFKACGRAKSAAMRGA